MAVFWNCKTTENSDYNAKIEYLSEPSADLIDKFKKEIITYKDPSLHEAYIQCDHMERSKGHMLFVLHGRVEVMIRPESATKKLFFTDCNENTLI